MEFSSFTVFSLTIENLQDTCDLSYSRFTPGIFIPSILDGDAEKQNVFVTAKMPRFLYGFAGNLGWRFEAKKYKTGSALMAKPHQA